MTDSSKPPRDDDSKTPRLRGIRAASVADRDQFVPKHEDSQFLEEERTSPHATPLETLESRSRRTLAATISGRGEVSQLRDEVRSNNQETNRRIDAMGEHVGNLREGFGELAGEQRATNATLGMLVKSIDAQSHQQAQHRVITMTAQVDVEKAEKLAVIDDETHAKKFKRDLVIKVVTVAGSIAAALATAVTLFATKC